MSDERDEQEGQSERGFTIVDRRGEARAEPEPEPEPRTEPPPRPPTGAGPDELPRIDFSTFLLSLGTSALYHMGMVADPESREPAPEPNLPLARQTIDTIEMLAEKTRGNLSEEEAHLLESLLYELRMRFVEASR